MADPGENPKIILANSDSNIAVDDLVEGSANFRLRTVRLGRPEAIHPNLFRHCIDRSQNNSVGDGGNNKDGNSHGPGFGGDGGSEENNVYSFKEKMKSLKNAQVVCCTCIGSGVDILYNTNFERVLVEKAIQAAELAVLVPLSSTIFKNGCKWCTTFHAQYPISSAYRYYDVFIRLVLLRKVTKWCFTSRT